MATGPAPGSLSTAAEAATKGLETTNKLLEDVRQGHGTLGKLVTDDTLYQQLNDFVESAEAVTRGINAGRGTLGRLTTNDAAARSLEQSLANLQEVTARIRNGEGSLGQLLNSDALSKSVTSTTNNLDAITGRINKGEGTAGKLKTHVVDQAGGGHVDPTGHQRMVHGPAAATSRKIAEVIGALDAVVDFAA